MANKLGTDNNDRLTGTSSSDRIDALGGNDTINGGGGNDIINSGVGDDRVIAGTGNDRIIADLGNDTVFAGGGKDTIEGGGGADSLLGGDGNDTIRGGADDDFLDGEFGDDVLLGDVGLDTLVGGFGSDFISGGADDDVINSHNSATSSTEWERDEMYGGAGTNTFNLFSNYQGGAANVANPSSESSLAIIMDFQVGIDALNLLFESADYSISYGAAFDADPTDDVDVDDTIISFNNNVVTVVVDAILAQADLGQIGVTPVI